MKINLYLIALVFLIISCDQSGGGRSNSLKQSARGEADEIILVVDSTQWADTTGIGFELRKTFSAPMLGLPQDEAIFDVSKVNPRRLNSVLKSAINMVFVMTLDSKTADSKVLQQYFTSQSLNQIKRDTSRFYIIKKDEFARGQTVMFLFAATEELLIQKLQYNRSQIREFFETSSKEVRKTKLYSGRSKRLESTINENLGVKMDIPYGWELARQAEDFIWLRKLIPETDSEQSLFIYYEPYRDRSMFNDIGAFRNRVTKKYLYDGDNSSVHITQQEIIPVFTERVNFNNHFAVEARSLWKISDASRGGPYVSYSIVDQDDGLVYYIEGYVDSPGTRKKKLVKELETILSTFKTKGDLRP